MFLNSDERKNDVYTISPLSHDYKGRFSRRGKIKKGNPDNRHTVLNSILIFIFCFCLLVTDFILFAGSGNIEVFKHSLLPTPEIQLGILFFAVVVAFTVLLLHKYEVLKCAFASLIAFGFVYAIFTQFAQIQQNVVFGTLHISSYMLFGLLSAGITYIVFTQRLRLFKYLLTVAVVVLLVDVYVNYINRNTPHEFIESFNSQKLNQTKDKRFVYFLLPNLVSYPYLNAMNIPEAQETKKIVQGFYQTNDFKVYMQAYTPEQDYLDNMIISFNPLSEKSVETHLLDTRLLSSYWQFQNLKTEYIYLKNNQLYDIFRKNKFQISAYKSRDFDMCHAKHKFNVNRCIEKINQPTNIYSMSLSTLEKAEILVIEWLSSWQLFRNISPLYNTLATLINADKMPLVGVNYNNLYVVNSIQTFDILAQDIQKDSGRQAYFVFADIPSNMYIYDEFCQLKPRQNWLDMANLPWIKKDYTVQRQTAYLQQTKCLYGKLAQFIDQLKEKNLWDNTIVIIQGISGVNNFKNYKYTKFLDNFIANRLVTMAIHDKNMKNTDADTELCSTNNILSKYLFNPNTKCNRAKLGIHHNLYQTLQQKMQELTLGANINYSTDFADWYQKWQNVNKNQATEEADIFQDFDALEAAKSNSFTETAIEEDFGLEDLRLSHNNDDYTRKNKNER